MKFTILAEMRRISSKLMFQRTDENLPVLVIKAQISNP